MNVEMLSALLAACRLAETKPVVRHNIVPPSVTFKGRTCAPSRVHPLQRRAWIRDRDRMTKSMASELRRAALMS